jgi:hypothetical protein
MAALFGEVAVRLFFFSMFMVCRISDAMLFILAWIKRVKI